MNIREYVEAVCLGAKKASSEIALADTALNNKVISCFARELKAKSAYIISENAADVAAAREYLCISDYDELHWKMMAAIWQSVADTAIIQAQDLFGLGSETRMNQPSTVGMNWRWRALPGVFTPELAAKLRHKMHIYGRLPE